MYDQGLLAEYEEDSLVMQQIKNCHLEYNLPLSAAVQCSVVQAAFQPSFS